MDGDAIPCCGSVGGENGVVAKWIDSTAEPDNCLVRVEMGKDHTVDWFGRSVDSFGICFTDIKRGIASVERKQLSGSAVALAGVGAVVKLERC